MTGTPAPANCAFSPESCYSECPEEKTKLPCSPNSKQCVAQQQQHPSLPGAAAPCLAPPSPGHAVLGGTPHQPHISPRRCCESDQSRVGKEPARRQTAWPGWRHSFMSGRWMVQPTAGWSQGKNSRPEPAWSPAWAGQACFAPILQALPAFKPPNIFKREKFQGPGIILLPSWEPAAGQTGICYWSQPYWVYVGVYIRTHTYMYGYISIHAHTFFYMYI